MKPTGWNRRDFLKTGVRAAGVAGIAGNISLAEGEPAKVAVPLAKHAALAGPGLTKYENDTLPRVAFPMGGIGAGMICLEGTGALSNISIRNRPDLFNEPCVFAAVAVKGSKTTARVVEGPVPGWKIFGMPDSGLGEGEHTFGFPRFRNASFAARFPFGTVSLNDPEMPVTVELTGWSPFTPGDANNSSLPRKLLFK